MSLTVVGSGKVYNGKVFEYVQNKGKEDERERKLFRGRLNYRDRQTNEWHWIDIVCFHDFGSKGGYVGFLEDNFLAEDGPKETGGQAIEFVGTLRPTQKEATVTVKGKGGATKDFTKEYITFELVIDHCEFATGSESGTKKPKKEDNNVDFDFDDDDDLEVVEDKKPSSSKEKGKEKSSSKPKNKKPEPKEEASTPSDDDDEFFDEE